MHYTPYYFFIESNCRNSITSMYLLTKNEKSVDLGSMLFSKASKYGQELPQSQTKYQLSTAQLKYRETITATKQHEHN